MDIHVLSGVLFLFLLHSVRANPPPCEDLNTAGCVLFLKNKPDLCSDPVLSASCKRFCGLCPLVCYDCPAPISHPGQCNTTSACAADERCMLRQHTGADGSNEYIMTCESNQTCDGLSFGFHSILGRRDLSFHCCDADYCNLPQSLATSTTSVTSPPTLTPSTTSPQPTLTPLPLHRCGKDIVFVIDGSSSIGYINHRYMVSFIESVIQRMTIGPQDSLVAMVEYSDTARVEWYLGDHLTKTSLSSAAFNIPYMSGTTATHAALWLARNSVLTSQHGDRPDYDDVVVILTDGGTSNHILTVSEAQQLRDNGVVVFGVGVGASVDSQEMVQLINSPGKYYHSTSFSQLTSLAAGLVSDICSA